MPVACPCGFNGKSLELHYRWSPLCRPSPVEDVKEVVRKRDFKGAHALFKNKVRFLMGREMLKAHQDKYISVAALDHFHTMLLAVVNLTLGQLTDLIASGLDGARAVEAAHGAFKCLPAAETLIRKEREYFTRAVPRTLSTGSSAEDASGAVFFSAYQVVTILLQESERARKHAQEFSEMLKSGKLYNVRPRVLSDVIHGSRFWKWFEVCGAASDNEMNDFRVVLHGWTDEFTPLDGLSQKARKHKYGAFLATLVNLPLHLRHYVDFVLMLALYNARYAKQNGGLVRMLTGTDNMGKKHDDGVTLATELSPGYEYPIIELPNDDDPAGEPRKWRLRIFLLMISLDWLAAGDFGPFAGSVSARHPCPKCKWTAECACAWMSKDDPRRLTVTHSNACKGRTPRTHDSVMHEVRELRTQLAKSKTAGQRFSTDTGIFAAYCASQFLLRDVVTDSLLDIMHLFLCSISRYLLSWVTDRLIPAQFSWDDLNRQNRIYPYGKGARVPDLERSKGDKRGSKSIHLNAAEMMHFALAR